jgi:hypothetical protein
LAVDEYAKVPLNTFVLENVPDALKNDDFAKTFDKVSFLELSNRRVILNATVLDHILVPERLFVDVKLRLIMKHFDEDNRTEFVISLLREIREEELNERE